ncbi:hypothetical protein IAQ61_002164 [Plenodomus lingam]|uniref:Predicted protein n=1 Tax=Leptosphaeria maculans (strain JN3 / isolate v23.1.3 / race Av1-4-5-6-7-8) TaxID=985895 RepID=E4ZHA5_LEPMJ|nr:predicted protein [Plenodomus lingam JN3]KAH9876803.1 hypothetical protein IAQ61_002164 [Plenodomus lingam]CBX90675.1 predicted protein [Plenodomus lingam JN3]
MQLITFLSAATAMMATASAKKSSKQDEERIAPKLNKECNFEEPHARIINRCPYPVHLWSVLKGDGCPDHGMVTLETGEVYSENYDKAVDSTGVSIKISKTEECKGNDIVQLEYFLQDKPETPEFNYNYLDVSYVDCLGNDCPTKHEGYYLVAGNQTGKAKASADNTWCPILSCHDGASCAKCSYILPDDVQTKTCDHHSSMEFYMCGGEAPTEEYKPAPVASDAPSDAPSPTPSPVASSSQAQSPAPAASPIDDDEYEAQPPVVTPVAVVNKEDESDPKTKTQVEVVYVTAYEYVNAKRHAHGHARRHQPFRA